MIVAQTQVANAANGSGYWNDNTTHSVDIHFPAVPAYEVAGMHLTVYSPAQSWHSKVVVTTDRVAPMTANQVFVSPSTLYFDDSDLGPCNPSCTGPQT